MAASNVVELIMKFRGDSGDLRSTMAQVRSEFNQTSQTQQRVNKGELSMKQQLASASSLQRQRSAALIGEWKRTERAAQQLASGARPVAQNLQHITDVMQTLRGTSAALEGPLGSVAGRLGSISSLTTQLGASGGPIALAVVGIVATTAAVGLLAKGLFDITKQSAEWQGALFDTSQQLGISVETLSALEVLAKTTGSSLDQITASLGIFQKNLEESQDSTSKQAKTFKELGVETLNTEDALRQTLTALAKMPEGFHQTATALELFGRGGKSILAILKEMDGDLDGTIAKLREMGLVVSQEDAKAADEFNDSLAVLQFQIRSLGATISKDVMPHAVQAIKQFQQAIKDNREEIKGLAEVAGLLAFMIGTPLVGAVRVLTSSLTVHLPWIRAVKEAYELAAAAAQLFAGVADVDPNAVPAVTPTGRSAAGVGAPEFGAGITRQKVRGGGGSRNKQQDTFLQDSLKDAALAEREALQIILANVAENKRAHEEQARDLQEFTRRAIELAEQRHGAIIDRINSEQQAIDAALAKKLISQKEYNVRDRELTLENTEAVQKKNDEIFELEQKRDREIAASQIAANERTFQMVQEAGQRIIDSIKDRVDRELLAESEGEKQIAEVIAEGFTLRKKFLQEELIAYGVTLERRAEINDELIRLEGERAGAAEDASRRIRAALEKEFIRRNQLESEGATRPRIVGEVDKSKSAIDQLIQKVTETFKGSEEVAAIAGINAMAEAFSGLAAAAGSALQAFILYGSAGTSLRKFAAEVISGVAVMAATKALFELAEAFAMLALNFFWPNPKYAASAAMHFKSAAIYGGIAAVAAVTGRAVAGNAFAGASGTGGSGSSGSSQPSQTSEPKPITLGSQRQMVEHKHIFIIKTERGFLAQEAANDIDSGGALRVAVRKEIKRQE